MNSCAAAPNRRNDHLSPRCSERLPSGKCCSRKRQRSWFSMQQLNAPRPNTSKWQSSHIEEPRLYPTTGPLGALYHRPDARIKSRPTPPQRFRHASPAIEETIRRPAPLRPPIVSQNCVSSAGHYCSLCWTSKPCHELAGNALFLDWVVLFQD